jgi:FKBP-type peptidyl-prolyl cis-trans isomerase 2
MASARVDFFSAKNGKTADFADSTRFCVDPRPFEANFEAKKDAKFRIGEGKVVKALETACLGLRKGETRISVFSGDNLGVSF